LASLLAPKAYASAFTWIWSTFSAISTSNAILTLFIIGFAIDDNGPSDNDFLHFLVFEIISFFLITVSEMEQFLKL